MDKEYIQVAINDYHGGFCLSEECLKRIREIFLEKDGVDYSLKTIDKEFNSDDICYKSVIFTGGEHYQYERILVRSHPYLLQAIREIGFGKSSGNDSSFSFKKVPKLLAEYAVIIEDGDGNEDEYGNGIEHISLNIAEPLVKILDEVTPEEIGLEDARNTLRRLKDIAEYYR